MQRGAVVALDEGDEFVRQNIVRATTSRDILCDALDCHQPGGDAETEGALYAFLKVDGITDSRQAALDIVDQTGVGLAPGTAFGEGDCRSCVPASCAIPPT